MLRFSSHTFRLHLFPAERRAAVGFVPRFSILADGGELISANAGPSDCTGLYNGYAWVFSTKPEPNVSLFHSFDATFFHDTLKFFRLDPRRLRDGLAALFSSFHNLIFMGTQGPHRLGLVLFVGMPASFFHNLFNFKLRTQGVPAAAGRPVFLNAHDMMTSGRGERPHVGRARGGSKQPKHKIGGLAKLISFGLPSAPRLYKALSGINKKGAAPSPVPAHSPAGTPPLFFYRIDMQLKV